MSYSEVKTDRFRQLLLVNQREDGNIPTAYRQFYESVCRLDREHENDRPSKLDQQPRVKKDRTGDKIELQMYIPFSVLMEMDRSYAETILWDHFLWYDNTDEDVIEIEHSILSFQTAACQAVELLEEDEYGVRSYTNQAKEKASLVETILAHD